MNRANPKAWPRWHGDALPVEPSFISSDGQLVHRAAQQGYGILLGNPDPALLPDETPLVPVLADQLGYELTFRCLSPVPTDGDPRTRSVLEGIHQILDKIAPKD